MMTRMKFSVDINADKDTIWEALWRDKFYREWVGVFSEGSYALTDNWKEGTRVHFLGADKSGIYSIINQHIPGKIIQFKHLGSVAKGKELPMNDGIGGWSGATETYTLTKSADGHTLTVDIDVLSEHVDFMTEKFPLALEKIRENCE